MFQTMACIKWKLNVTWAKIYAKWNLGQAKCTIVFHRVIIVMGNHNGVNDNQMSTEYMHLYYLIDWITSTSRAQTLNKNLVQSFYMFKDIRIFD